MLKAIGSLSRTASRLRPAKHHFAAHFSATSRITSNAHFGFTWFSPDQLLRGTLHLIIMRMSLLQSPLYDFSYEARRVSVIPACCPGPAPTPTCLRRETHLPRVFTYQADHRSPRECNHDWLLLGMSLLNEGMLGVFLTLEWL